MAERSEPIYQLRLVVDSESAADIDAWLDKHVRKSLSLPEILDCNTFAFTVDDTHRSGRACQYSLASDAALADYLESGAAQVEAELLLKFGDAVDINNRVLREDRSRGIPAGDSSNCLNCGTELRGQYCGTCGQRSRSRLISLWELVSDAFGDLFELDSRLWRTLVPLVTRPGQLTHDYLQGRRARFMPPFRMYLVLSLVFFVVAFFNPREELSLFFEPPATDQQAAANDASADSRGPIFVLRDDEDEAEDAEDEDCDIQSSDLDGLSAFLTKRLTAERLRQVCLQILADEGKSVTQKVINNVPAALIVLLPLMALVLKALYPLSRRYYVEHLLFFVHFHAFVFLLLTLEILFVRLATLVALPDAAVALTVVAASLYAPVYLFIAMRRVYGQGRFVTFLKYIVLTIAYSAGFCTIMALTCALAAFSM